MKILVTGGAGFIASHIVDAYIGLGHDVVVFDNLSTGRIEFINKKAKFYQLDITDRKAVKKVLGKEKPVVINHHAAQISVRNSVDDPVNDCQINLVGLLNLLEEGRVNGLKKIITASSGGVVYGEAEVIPTPENYVPLKPLSPYGVSKLASEYYLYFYHRIYGIPYVALRYSNVFGPRQNPHGEAGVVAIFSQKLLNQEIPVINGDGRQTRDYVFVEDVVVANVSALKIDATGEYNIGTSRETDVNQLFKLIKSAVGTHILATHGKPKAGEQKRSCLNNSKAKKYLKWLPRYTLEQGLAKTVEYFKST